MKKSTSKKVAKRVDPFAGIPEAERKDVEMAAAMSVYMGKKPMAMQEVWAIIQARRLREEEEKAEGERQRVNSAREWAIEQLAPALGRLATCRDTVGAIEDDLDSMSYIDHQDMAGFIRLAIEDAGAKLEQALCDLGFILDQEHGHFVQNLKSRLVKMEPKPEEEEAEEAT